MDFRLIWKTILAKPTDHVPVYSLCFKPDCSQLIVACSNDLFFIDPQTGNVIDQRRRPHYAPIYCVRCSDDGSFFASSSSDGCVVIWRSFNNEGFITYGSKSGAVRQLEWCPGKQMLVSCTQKEYNIWRPEDTRASINQTKESIETIAFAPDGETFLISYTTGTVNVLSTEKLEVLQTFSYSSIVTALKFTVIGNEDYIVTSDLDCRVSLFRASDKSLVGKNAIPFEALSCNTVYVSQSNDNEDSSKSLPSKNSDLYEENSTSTSVTNTSNSNAIQSNSNSNSTNPNLNNNNINSKNPSSEISHSNPVSASITPAGSATSLSLNENLNKSKSLNKNDSSFFFLFAGVSGKVSLLTSGLSYLGDFKTDSDWIWDTAVDKTGRVAIATREGFVELRSIDFGLSFASAGDIVAYRTSLNAMIVRNIVTGEKMELTFFRIIVSIQMSPRYILVQFRDSVVVYRHERDIGEDPELTLNKVYEIPGNFENYTFAISRSNVVCADNSEKSTLKVFDLTGQLICQFTFGSKINCITNTSAIKDGTVVGCSDGHVFFVIFDQEEPVVIAKHDRPIIFAQRQASTVALIDEDHNCVLYDSMTNQLLQKYENITSFAFSSHVEGLYAISDGTSLSVHFLSCIAIPQFIEGQILGFVRGQIMLSKDGALELVNAPLPLTQLLQEGNWKAVVRLAALGLNSEQAFEVVKAAAKAKKLDIAMRLAPLVSRDLSSFIFDLYLLNQNPKNQSTYDSMIKKRFAERKVRISSSISNINNQLLHPIDQNETEPSKGKKGDKNSNKDKPEKDDQKDKDAQKENRGIQLEAEGDPEEALLFYAGEGDWKNVLRVAKANKLERQIVDLDFPLEESENAAKVLLEAGLGDSAIRILSKTDNVAGLARARIYLGQWYEAISLSRLYSIVYNIIYPRFGQLLFESGQWFESLVCFFIPKERDDRLYPLIKLEQTAADASATDELSFIRLMTGFAEPECFWRAQAISIGYLAADRIKRFIMMPLTLEEGETVFCLCYYLLAIIRNNPMRGITLRDVLIMFLITSANLGLKRWVHYALNEISGFPLSESLKQLIQMHVHASTETPPLFSFPCPRCGKDLYGTGRAPSLICSSCGARLAFSAYSCHPLSLVGFDIDPDSSQEEIKSSLKTSKHNDKNDKNNKDKNDKDKNDKNQGDKDKNDKNQGDKEKENKVEKTVKFDAKVIKVEPNSGKRGSKNVNLPNIQEDMEAFLSELILEEPDDTNEQENPPKDMEEIAFIKKTPTEALFLQKIKKKAGVNPRIWYNGARENIHMCRCCGAMLNELDYENSVLENDKCPLCKNPCFSQDKNMNVEVKSDILEMLRSFEEESPVFY